MFTINCVTHQCPVKGGWGCERPLGGSKGRVKLKNMIRIKQAWFSENLKNIETKCCAALGQSFNFCHGS